MKTGIYWQDPKYAVGRCHSDPSCVLHLPLHRLDGASFMSKDAYGHLCTVTGALWKPQGRLFDGSDDYIDCGNDSALDSVKCLTVKLWYKTSSLISGRALICRDPALYKYMLYITGGSNEVTFYFKTASGTIAAVYNPGAGIIADGNWHHVVGVWKRPYGKLYFDGVEVSTTAERDEDIIAGTDYLAIGRYSGSYIPAEIGEVWLKNRALTPLEIQCNYLATKWRYQ